MDGAGYFQPLPEHSIFDVHERGIPTWAVVSRSWPAQAVSSEDTWSLTFAQKAGWCAPST